MRHCQWGRFGLLVAIELCVKVVLMLVRCLQEVLRLLHARESGRDKWPRSDCPNMAKRDKSWIFLPVAEDKATSDLDYYTKDQSIPSSSGDSPKKIMETVARNGMKLKNLAVMQKLSVNKGGQISNNICMTTFHHPHEQRQLTDAALRLRESDSIGDAYEILEEWPLEQLLSSIPYSLPLLEALYANFLALDRHSFPCSLLRPDLLMQHILWWAAFEETANSGKAAYKLRDDLEKSVTDKSSTGSISLSCSTLSKRPEAHCWHTVLPNIISLVRITHNVDPNVLKTLSRERNNMKNNLESLGLHGLVNCGETQLIDISDAVRGELTTHQQKLKSITVQFDKTHNSNISSKTNHAESQMYSVDGGGRPPSTANHQRLMAVKLSHVRNRMHINETTLQTLRLALRNNDLETLQRILTKRVDYDKQLLTLVDGLKAQSTCNYGLASEDPTVSSVLVQFKKAYDKLLEVFPVGALEDNISECASSPQTGERSRLSDSPDSCNHIKTGRLLGPVAQLIKSKSSRCHRSLTDLTESLSDPLYTNPRDILNLPLSLSNINNSKSTSNILTKDNSMFPYQAPQGMNHFPRDHMDRMEIDRLRAEVNRLSRDLTHSNKLVQKFSKQKLSVDSGVDYCGSTSSTASSSSGEIPRPLTVVDPCPAPVHKYRTLFTKDRVDTIQELNKLPDLAGSPELQMKIIFSVIVLSFRSVSEVVSAGRKEVWESLDIDSNEEKRPYAQEFSHALNRFMLSRAKINNGMDNAKEVTSQIWQALPDFPSLKTCMKFNRFILDCIQVGWELVAGVEGSPPLFVLDYDASKAFDAEKHLRFQGSSLRSTDVQRFIWPGLIDSATGNCVYKGVVVT